MKEIALYALLNGVSFTAQLHSLEVSTVRNWIRELDFDSEPFFKRIRELVYTAAIKSNVRRTSELFDIPEIYINLLLEDFNKSPISDDLKRAREINLTGERSG
jgi:hypothetical protein